MPHWLLDVANTECGKQYKDISADPDMRFCPFCGKRIIMHTVGEQLDEILKRVNQ